MARSIKWLKQKRNPSKWHDNYSLQTKYVCKTRIKSGWMKGIRSGEDAPSESSAISVSNYLEWVRALRFNVIIRICIFLLLIIFSEILDIVHSEVEEMCFVFDLPSPILTLQNAISWSKDISCSWKMSPNLAVCLPDDFSGRALCISFSDRETPQDLWIHR